MESKPALVLLTFVSPLLLLILILGGSAAIWLGIPLICLLPLVLIALSAPRRRAPRGFLLALWLLLSGSWLAVAWLSATADLSRPSVGQAAAVMGLMVFGLGLIPLALIGWIFARSFKTEGLAPEDLKRLRQGPGTRAP